MYSIQLYIIACYFFFQKKVQSYFVLFLSFLVHYIRGYCTTHTHSALVIHILEHWRPLVSPALPAPFGIPSVTLLVLASTSLVFQPSWPPNYSCITSARFRLKLNAVTGLLKITQRDNLTKFLLARVVYSRPKCKSILDQSRSLLYAHPQ